MAWLVPPRRPTNPPKPFDPLQRLALAPCERFEDGSLVLLERLAHHGDQHDPPGPSGLANEDGAEQCRVR